MAIAPRKLTYDDYAALPDDGKRYQLIDGVLVLTPSGTPFHQDLVGRLHLELGLYLRQHPGTGKVYVAPLDVVLDPHQVLQPDVLFIAGDRQGIVGPRYIAAAPDLAIEVLSPTTARLDLGRKRELYEQFGVREFWAVHQSRPLVEVFRRQCLAGQTDPPSGFAPPDKLDAAGTLTTPLLPGFSLQVAELFGGLPHK